MKSLEQDVAMALAMLRRRINGHQSRIYRLHPEVLSHIASKLPRNALVKATHVSHHWRTVLLAFPSLWADVSFLYEEQAPVFAERSKSAPIYVTIAPFRVLSPTEIKLLKHHATRIETLVIYGFNPRVWTLLPSMRLRKLDIALDETGGSRHADANLNLPTVTTLMVQGSDTFPFNVPQLTKLRVYSGETLMICELLHLLNNCPLLEELEIGYNRGAITRDDVGTVELPHLRLYNHHMNTNTHLVLFDYLRVPPFCSVVFHYWNGSTDSHQPHADTPFYNPSPLACTKRVKVKTVEQKGGSIDATIELIDVRGTRARLMRNLGRTRFDGILDHSIVDGLYVTYLKGLDTFTVDVFCVGGPAPWSFGSAQEVLSHLGGIRTLVLSGAVVMSYLEALSPEPDEDAEEDSNTDGWLCPRLSVLVIHVQNFFYYNNGDIMELLVGAAQRRKEAGIPFKFVSMFISTSWDEYEYGPLESSPVLELLRGSVEKIELAFGDDVMDWDIDNFFFDGLSIRRDQYLFPEQTRYDPWYDPL